MKCLLLSLPNNALPSAINEHQDERMGYSCQIQIYSSLLQLKIRSPNITFSSKKSHNAIKSLFFKSKRDKKFVNTNKTLQTDLQLQTTEKIF